jgi:uncharacterized protein YndB with AHSA1/START domain
LADYQLVTVWQIAAPIEPVWNAIYEPGRWPEWWPFVARVEELEPGQPNGIGAVRRFTWRSRLPYQLTFDLEVTLVDRPHRLEGRTRGDLKGRGIWTLLTVDGGTRVRYDWTVTTTRFWMNLLAPLARPVFTWNHHAVMRAGGRGLAERLKAPLVYAGPERR